MDKTSRALRRHHRARLLRREFNKQMYSVGWPPDEEWALWRARRLWNNPCNCSCSMCRNERRNPWTKAYDRLTMQEKKALDAANDSLQEAYNL